jgi:ATP-dependent protease ClpP protease subunit
MVPARVFSACLGGQNHDERKTGSTQRQSLHKLLLLLQTMNKVVFIREPVSEDVANNMIALTLYLDSLDKKRIYYWLNCPGGDVSTGLLS